MASETTFPTAPPDAICLQVLAEARHAALRDEIPVAAGLYRLRPSPPGPYVWEFVAMGSNRTIEEKNPLAHAEFSVIEKGRQQLCTEYLSDCALVASLEPCLFCTGALLLSRVGAIYYFAQSTKGLRLGDVIQLSLANKAGGQREGVSNHHPIIASVPAHAEAARLLLEGFFRGKRSQMHP